jgi:hypothetical protein
MRVCGTRAGLRGSVPVCGMSVPVSDDQMIVTENGAIIVDEKPEVEKGTPVENGTRVLIGVGVCSDVRD